MQITFLLGVFSIHHYRLLCLKRFGMAKKCFDSFLQQSKELKVTKSLSLENTIVEFTSHSIINALNVLLFAAQRSAQPVFRALNEQYGAMVVHLVPEAHEVSILTFFFFKSPIGYP
jgi:hypothetical protein